MTPSSPPRRSSDRSALYDGDGKADNIAMVRARLSADAELMQRILSSEGFYDGRVDTRIERTPVAGDTVTDAAGAEGRRRSEEHTSELQSLMRISYAVFCLEKKKTVVRHGTE